MSRRLKAFIPFALLAIAWIGCNGIGATAHTQGFTEIPESSCNPRDPLSECYVPPPRGIPVGELVIVDDFF